MLLDLNKCQKSLNGDECITDRFVKPFMMDDEFLVLLPCSDQIVRNGMEDFAIDFGLDKHFSRDSLTFITLLTL